MSPLPELTWVREGVDARGAGDNPAPDEKVIAIERKIAGGEFNTAGAAATEVKHLLKKLAVAPKTVRQAAIACFEAEINVIVYADGGTMTVSVSPRKLHVVVKDRGPGIPDIERAMQPGFTTASAEIQEMGFGAGMGLPNIQQNVDYLRIHSEPGVGTELTFDIFLDRTA